MTTVFTRWMAVLAGLQCVIAALAAVIAIQNSRSQLKPDPAVAYYGILLTSGHVLFGHLEVTGDGYYVLTDAYYLRSQGDQQTKEVRSILVRRGNEWHEPSQTIINASNILFMEPVGAESGVMKRIAEIKRQMAPTTGRELPQK